jgi:hypothetical protein
MAFGAAFETLHQESHKLEGLFFVLIDDDGLYLLLFRGRKRNLFVCHSFSPYLDLVLRRQAAPERMNVNGWGLDPGDYLPLRY